jgi:N-acetylglutamate synthase-like GNAT family acetyltransferase
MLVLPADFTPASLPLKLCDGRGFACVLRKLNRNDDAALLRFFRSHTRQTLLQRYGTEQVDMTPEKAARLVGVDQDHDAALALFEADEQGDHIIAVGRYICASDGVCAEMAFVVHEKRRRRGLCSLLLGALTVLARAQGLKELFAQTQEDNFAMLGIFLKAGAIISIIEGTHAVDVRMPILPLPGKPAKRRLLGFRKRSS